MPLDISIQGYLETQSRTLIHSHFLSRLTYACQVWSGSIGSNIKKRIESCYFKVIRLLCWDFKARKGRDQLLIDSGVISLRSTFIIRDAKLLHTSCTTMTSEPIFKHLLSQCHFIAARCGNRLFFIITVPKRLAAAVL